MIDVDGAEAGADVAGEEDGVEDEEGDEEQVEGRLHLRRADAGIGWFLTISLLLFFILEDCPPCRPTRLQGRQLSGLASHSRNLKNWYVLLLSQLDQRNSSHNTAMAKKFPRKPKRPSTMLVTPVSQYFHPDRI